MEQRPLQLEGKNGAAFLLRQPTGNDACIEHPEGTVTLTSGGRLVAVNIDRDQSAADLRDAGWRIVQEAFDIRAATHRQALSTRRADHQYLLWRRSDDQYELTVVDTIHSTWNMVATGVVSDGSQKPRPLARIEHHPALRFYRLSQLSEDLFDAYRNAYLALECLISDVSKIRQGEKENGWLARVLTAEFSHVFGTDTSISETVELIYDSGRTHVFHAKTGRDFYLPQGAKRHEIQDSFILLQWLVARLLRERLGEQISGGWGAMSQAVTDAQNRVYCDVDQISYEGIGASFLQNVSLNLVESPRRFGQFWAYSVTRRPRSLSALSRIVYKKDCNEYFWSDLDQTVSLENVSSIRVELNFLSSNSKAPNPLHPS